MIGEPIDYHDLIGLPYQEEVNDCFQLARKYFHKLGIELTDYAFPSDWWAYDDNLYLKHYADEGFRRVVTDDWTPQLHDVMLVQGSLLTTTPTHAGILVEPNTILHHYTGRLSEVSPFTHPWRAPALVLRHKDVKLPGQVMTEVLIGDLMPRHIRERFISRLTDPATVPVSEDGK